MKLYQCSTCGKIVQIIKDSKSPLICCGKPMEELIPGTTDAAVEKHVPAVSVKGNKVCVKVGEVAHPMAEEHYIEWIAIGTKQGCQCKGLKPGDAPEAEFTLSDSDEFVQALAYCNLHSLWASK